MDESMKPESGRADGAKTDLLVRGGRGRNGGSTGCDVFVQRARYSGRRVKPLDGDLRTRTLSVLYPSVDEHGQPIEDGASAPKSDELPHIKEWFSDELDLMVRTRVSRVLDLSGGDRVLQEYVRDLELEQYCKDHDVGLTVAVFLGPDMDDFRHATQLLGSGGFKCDRTLLVLNEGVVGAGQTTAGVFDAIASQPEFERLTREGARTLFMRRLACMARVRERGLRFYDLFDWSPSSPGSLGASVSPTLQHMTKTWLVNFEQEIQKSGVADWLP